MNLTYSCPECGNIDFIHDDKDNITFCGVCGFIREIMPRWSLTHEDILHIFNCELDEDTDEVVRTYFEPPTRSYGKQKYDEQSGLIFEQLGIK